MSVVCEGASTVITTVWIYWVVRIKISIVWLNAVAWHLICHRHTTPVLYCSSDFLKNNCLLLSICSLFFFALKSFSEPTLVVGEWGPCTNHSAETMSVNSFWQMLLIWNFCHKVPYLWLKCNHGYIFMVTYLWLQCNFQLGLYTRPHWDTWQHFSDSATEIWRRVNEGTWKGRGGKNRKGRER